MPNLPKYLLHAYLPDGQEVSVEISKFPCTIGRKPENDLVLNDSSVSSHHALLMLGPDGVAVLEDRLSTNGIYCNKQKVSALPLDRRRKVVLGKVTLEITPVETSPDSEIIHPSATISRKAGAGLAGIICPHCWHNFRLDEFLFISRHQSLIGDPVLGSDAQQRFLPSRFTAEGNAIDAMGMSCPDMACPRCHLRIPLAASEMPPLFLSIVGATASGKSYFLTSMSWGLRNTLNRDFAISFADTDAVNNQIINDFEESLFLNSDQETPVALRKTELQGELYNQVLLDNMLVNLPKPFMFTITPAEHHPHYQEVKASMSRTLVLYDNAGEHFEPGMDLVDNPTTQHLLHSDTIFFIYDPTKDVRFRKLISGSDDFQLSPKSRVQRQEIILTEMISRIKKYSGLRSGGKIARNLIVVISKCDIWKQLLGFELPAEPWKWDPAASTCCLDVEFLRNVSFAIRNLLTKVCPELVTTAETFSGDVLYLPNSALGHSPKLDDNGMSGISPADIHPFWSTVPMLYFFYEHGFIPALSKELSRQHQDTPVEYRKSGDLFFVTIPGLDKPLRVPLCYGGSQLQCPGTDIWFTLPSADQN